MTTKVTNVYNLKLTPSQFGQSSLVVNCSQYDSLYRVIQFNLFNGNAVYSIPEGSVVTIRGTKKDNTGFEYECDYSNNVVTFPLQQQITIFPGKVPAELRITNNGEIIGSWNFLFLVEESPLSDNTTISETQLPLLEQAIEAADRLNEAFDDITQFTDETYPNAVQAVQSEGATQVANVTNEGTTQVANVQAKGAEVLASIPADYTEISEDVLGETVSIPFVQTGSGYIYDSSETVVSMSYSSGGTGNNQMMVINDLNEYGLSAGDTLEITVGWSTGYKYAVGFTDYQITGNGYVTNPVEYISEDAVQTIRFTIPVGTVGMAIFNRKTAYNSPTISKNGGGLVQRVTDAEANIEELQEKSTEIKYHSCVSKPFDFSGKSCYFFGDSLTYGYIAESGGIPVHQATNQYPKLFAEAVDASYVNYGESGTTLAETTYGSIYTKIQNTALNSDYVFVAGGVNDWQVGVDEETLVTAVTNICEYLSANYTGEVIFITPINEAGRTPIVTPTQTLQNVRNVITRVALKYGYSVVQGWEFPFPTESDDADYIDLMFQDKLHPSELGYSMYAQALRSTVC